MLQKKNEGILFSAEIRVVGSYTDRLLKVVVHTSLLISLFMSLLKKYLLSLESVVSH